jgi:WD40 repeat protein
MASAAGSPGAGARAPAGARAAPPGTAAARDDGYDSGDDEDGALGGSGGSASASARAAAALVGDATASEDFSAGLSTIGEGIVRAGRGVGGLAAGASVAAADASLRAAAGLARAAAPHVSAAGTATRRGAGTLGRLAGRSLADVELALRLGGGAAARLALFAVSRVDALSFGVGVAATALVWLSARGARRDGGRGGGARRRRGSAAEAEAEAEAEYAAAAAAIAAAGEGAAARGADAAARAAAADVSASAAAAAADCLSDDADAAAAARGRVHAHVLRALSGHVATLERAGRAAEARALFVSLEWQQVLLDAGGLTLLMRDLTRRSVNDRALALLAQVLRRAAPALRRERAAEALPGQLLGRLGRPGAPPLPPDVASLLREAAAWRAVAPWLRPLQPSLDAPGGALEVSLEGHTEAVTAIALLPHAGRVATGSRDGTIRVWDPSLAACVALLEGHNGGITSLAPLPDGRLASGSLDGTLRLWAPLRSDGSAGGGGAGPPAVCEKTLPAGKVFALATVGVTPAAAAAGGGAAAAAAARVAVGGEGADVALWHVGRGVIDARLRGHVDRVTALAALPDGTRLASASADGELRLWHVARRACLAVFPAGKVIALAALGRGRLAAANVEGVRVWDLDAVLATLNAGAGDADGLTTPPPDFALASGKVNALCGVGDGRVVTGSDHMIRTWAAGDPSSSSSALPSSVRAIKGRRCATTALAALPDGRIVSGGADGVARIWAALDGAAAASGAGAPSQHDNRVTALAALPGGRAVSGSWDCTLRLWAADGRCEKVLSGHNQRVTCVVATDDGHIVSSADAQLRVWGASDGGMRRALDGAHGRAVTCLVALRRGRVASGSEDATIKVWVAATGAVALTLTGHTERVTSLAALGATMLLSGSGDGTARVWCVRSGGAPLATLKGHADAVTAVACLPRKALLLTGGDDKVVCVWAPSEGVHPSSASDAESSDAEGHPPAAGAPAWALAATLRGHSDAIRSLVPLDDDRCASLGARDSLRIWNAATRACEGVYRAATVAPVPGAPVTPDAPRGAAAAAAAAAGGGGGGGAAGAPGADSVTPPEAGAAFVYGSWAHVGSTFGSVPCYVDDVVRALVVLPPPPPPAHGGGGADADAAAAAARAPVVVAATDAGAVHFLQVCAPPPAR